MARVGTIDVSTTGMDKEWADKEGVNKTPIGVVESGIQYIQKDLEEFRRAKGRDLRKQI